MQSPSSIAQVTAPAMPQPGAEPDVGEVLRRMDVGRTLSDAELEQHIADCRCLMERAHARWIAHGCPHDRDEAELWMHQRDEAHKALSPTWKAAREAQIQAAVDAGTTGCYFMDQGDAALARRRG